MVRVYIWYSKVVDRAGSSGSVRDLLGLSHLGWNWGHVAVEIPDEESPYCPRHYMSYWPPHLKPGKCSYYYPDDEVSCGSADSIVEIIGLNEAVLPAVWAKELDKDFNNVSHNCCTVSATLLLEGLRATVFSGVGSYFRTAWRQFRSAGHTFDVSLDSLFGNLVVWDPNAVENLAKYTKRLVAP